MRPYVAASALLLIPALSLAQTFGGGGPVFTPSFSISVDPAYPAPNSTATLSFLSTSLDLANATIEVSVNGKPAYVGTVRPVPVQLGKTGSVSSVSATLTLQGKVYSQTLVLEPEDVVLVAEPQSSAPALYPGKPGVPLGGTVRVVAVANVRTASGALIAPAALSYAWTVDDAQVPNGSGLGKNALIVAAPLQYRSRTVSVAVKSGDGALSGGATIALAAELPEIFVYQNDPLLGVRFERTLADSYAVSGSETSLFAAPFSFPLGGGTPLISWFLNGASAQQGNSITLRPTGSGTGNASLSVVASGSAAAKATANLQLSFGQSSSPGFFGL